MNSKYQYHSRRKFLAMGVGGVVLFTTGCGNQANSDTANLPTTGPFSQLPDIGPLGPPDANGVRLPAGYSSRIVAVTGREPVTGCGYLWHMAPDGGACYATDDGGWVYVSNSEVRNNGGGVGALRFDADGNVIDAYPILADTSVNCAGGATPWHTWLSCEEHDNGQVYECDPFGVEPARRLPQLGSFRHEAVAVDIDRGHLYLTEDQRDGGFYRFRPDSALPDLSSGVLEIAVLPAHGQYTELRWQEVTDPAAETVPTRHQVPGYAAFQGGEGIAYHDHSLFFTTKHDNRVWRYHADSNRLDVIYDVATNANPILSGVDNVVITPMGDVLIAEDGGDMQLVALPVAGGVVPLLQIIGHESSEICGPAFNPSFEKLYFSSQRGEADSGNIGLIYEISAPA